MTDRLDMMRAMAARQPDNPLARFGFANELLKAGQLADAAVELEAYLTRYDDEGNGWMRFADTLHALGRTTEARDALTTGMAAAERFGHAALVSEMEERDF